MKTILGTTELGISVMEMLLQSNVNEEITLVNTSGRLEMKLPENVKLIGAELTNRSIMEDIASRSEIIFSCIDFYSKQSDAYFHSTASSLADALTKTTARLVVADNLRSYGNMFGKLMHEGLPHKAKTMGGSLRASAIQTLLLSGCDFNHRVAIVKAADLLGPGVKNQTFGIDFLDKLYKSKTVILYGNINLPHVFTFVTDLARAMVNVGGAADTFGKIWHVPNAPPMGRDKWIHLFEVSTGRKAKAVLLPITFLRVAGMFSEPMQKFSEFAYEFQYPYLVDHSKFTSRFGNDVTYPSSVVKQTVKWYETKNQL